MFMDVSEERSASIFIVEEMRATGTFKTYVN
jgi:hypothetical protein